MVRKELGVTKVEDLDGATICVMLGTVSEQNLSDFFKAHRMELRMLRSEVVANVAKDYDRGRCDAVTSNRSSLASFRADLGDPTKHVILPYVISKKPLGPVVRQGDNQWLDIVRWVIFALIQAEESGVTAQNVEAMKSSQNPFIRRLLGVSGSLGRQLGLADDWAFQIVKQVGNYGEIYERNLGPNTPLGLERGPNALWSDGGLMYSNLFR